MASRIGFRIHGQDSCCIRKNLVPWNRQRVFLIAQARSCVRRKDPAPSGALSVKIPCCGKNSNSVDLPLLKKENLPGRCPPSPVRGSKSAIRMQTCSWTIGKAHILECGLSAILRLQSAFLPGKGSLSRSRSRRLSPCDTCRTLLRKPPEWGESPCCEASAPLRHFPLPRGWAIDVQKIRRHAAL